MVHLLVISHKEKLVKPDFYYGFELEPWVVLGEKGKRNQVLLDVRRLRLDFSGDQVLMAEGILAELNGVQLRVTDEQLADLHLQQFVLDDIHHSFQNRLAWTYVPALKQRVQQDHDLHSQAANHVGLQLTIFKLGAPF